MKMHRLGVAVAGWFFLSLHTGCQVSSSSDEVGAAAVGDSPPSAKVEAVSRPIPTSRMAMPVVVPDADGRPIFIAQLMNYKYTTGFEYVRKDLPDGRQYVEFADTNLRPDAEWVVADLETGKAEIQELPGFHSTALCRAENGRVFFNADFAHIYYFEPSERKVKILGQIFEWKPFTNERGFYRLILGPDGMVYGTTQSYDKKTSLVRINPDTLEVKTWRGIGRGIKQDTLTYGYYLEVVPPWVYVAVGQDAWELFAVNLETDERHLLAERTGTGSRITVGDGKIAPKTGLTGETGRQWVGKERTEEVSAGKVQSFWCADGYLFPGNKKDEEIDLPFVPLAERSFPVVEWKNTRPLPLGAMPTVEPKSLIIDMDGTARLEWSPANRPDEKKQLEFRLKHTEPATIESLISLPDGSLLGNVKAYQGFFRYDPKSGKTDVFRNHGPSGVRSVVVGGNVYFSGYPNMGLWCYDPEKPWTSKGDVSDPACKTTNPAFLTTLGQGVTEGHYCRFIADGGNGRIYLAGKRERWATGTGLGYYELASGTRFGLREALTDRYPEGLAVLPSIGRIVLSGKLREAKGGETAELIVYDLDLKELNRLPIDKGLESGGRLFPLDADGAVLGVVEQDKKSFLYRYSIKDGKLEKSVVLSAVDASPVFRKPADGSCWIILDGVLNRLEPETLTLIPVADLGGHLGFPCWDGNVLYGTRGGELVQLDWEKNP